MVEGEVGSIATRRGVSPNRPALIDVQFAAPSSVLKTPPDVAAYTVAGLAGSIARALTVTCGAPIRPLLAAAQLWPPSLLLKTPASVPANSVEGVEGSIARAKTLAVGIAPSAAAQLPPPS